ncbi:hypothetical protein ZEAMMB73_Zm00001d004757 [Zea mays]|uniref:Transposase Tnp1/En/Spm-like domain-containing protein n=1 Tax=Zea mays TaxID=4577 RepID=A0A1R3NFG6_MAIZE|nr:hypothetical protein ZEAMMB73_Zm00001d004757 [Zea mays]
MPRGRRKQTVESNEEYLSEDHVGQKKLQRTLAHESDSEMEEESFAVGGHDQSGEVSEMEPNSKNPTDMDADIEVEDEETNVEVKRRGKTKLLQVWNIPRGHRIVVQCNELDQPIGEEAGMMGKFLGMVARNGNLCSLSYKDWRLLIGKKERLTNEQKNKEDILKQVKRRFLYPARMEKWVLKTIGERWRQHKSNLKSIYYDAHKGLEANYNNVPPGVIADQWIALVNHWVTTKAKELLAEHPEFADTSQGKIAWNGDALNKILGEEKPGHVHGLGLVPNPNKVLDGTTSRRLNQLHVTSLDPTASEDVLSLKLQMEKLVNHGCLDDLPANQFPTSSKRKRVYVEPQNQEFRMDNEKTYSQREQEAKEYEDLQQTFRKTSTIHKVLCYLITHLSRFHGIMQTLIICIELKKIKVADTRQGKLQRTDRLPTTHKTRQFELERDITFDNTKLANSSKSMTKEATSTSLNEEASKNQVKRKDMQSATTFDKTKCATTSKTGAQVFLKSWRCPTKTVALGTVLGRDPNHKVGGVKLGREFWMVRVRLVILPIEPLIRPYDNMEVIGDVGNNLIAWPSCCIEDDKN